ncbi:NADH-dependent [FeFe] hydrogenase, group A6 [Desulfitobacterium sp.]|uniref:NADH-dependent [FeFe] hydrogenase, group A6 n=1 Tax=Desulfitobacterium sp. TaxID=49981 RepID=UPI002B1F6DA3|nr:NADH-dependent [FeFe] hydrogenase, group A6 [Desulfitobacterium sp.]MEA4901323.1 NADH-dependent [FeFe] hydrogenase, group A6 [Desulfitobacterium sp.]
MDVNIKINDVELGVPSGYTVLEAAHLAKINIPSLCHMKLKDMNVTNHVASCRVCMVEVEGKRNLAPACSTVVSEGMVIRTNTDRAMKARRTSVELLLSDHPSDCLVCAKNQKCDLQKIAADLGIRGQLHYQGEKSKYPKDLSSKSIIRDPEKCILCRRCETMCNEVQTCGILSAVDRGFKTVVKPTFGLPLAETMCTFCGQCVAVCPTGALTEANNVNEVWDAIHNPNKYVVVQTAPAVRVALGEEFGLEAGSNVTGKMVTALRNLGFKKVFDTDFAADLTIVEEASEFVHRLQQGGKLPMLTSCCPAWINFLEYQFPDLLDNPSTCKSPHEMLGAVIKTYYAHKMNIAPEQIVVVSVMPCVAKKYEASRSELSQNQVQNVDYVLTTRELAIMINETGMDFSGLDDGEFDSPLGESTGVALIFGATGGVMEAALRTAYEWLTGDVLENLEMTELRGFKGIREASIPINGEEVKIAIANGLGNARKLLEDIRKGKSDYALIEVMACPGGCIGGAGQPYHHGDSEIIKKRAQALYREDREMVKRKSHKNEDVLKLYHDFLGEFYGEKAHELLHTHYTNKRKTEY